MVTNHHLNQSVLLSICRTSGPVLRYLVTTSARSKSEPQAAKNTATDIPGADSVFPRRDLGMSHSGFEVRLGLAWRRMFVVTRIGGGWRAPMPRAGQRESVTPFHHCQ